MKFLSPLICCAALLAAGAAVAAPDLEVQASGAFLNAGGDVLTARHAVADCRSLFVVKDSRVTEATVAAASPELDLAVLRTSLKPYLSVTLARTANPPGASIGVFAESYSALRRLPDRATLLSNAITIPAGEGLQMLSGVQPGASGSAVLSQGGLLLGVVVERVAASPGSASHTLSRGPAGARSTMSGATQVHAVPAARIRAFLQEHRIEFSESDAPQLGPAQSPAARASTLAVGVICG